MIAMDPLAVNPGKRRYRAMIGVGGIGTVSFFALDGNRTLGREESRGGRFIDRNDYCKLHIVSHYVKALLGRGPDPFFVLFRIPRRERRQLHDRGLGKLPGDPRVRRRG